MASPTGQACKNSICHWLDEERHRAGLGRARRRRAEPRGQRHDVPGGRCHRRHQNRPFRHQNRHCHRRHRQNLHRRHLRHCQHRHCIVIVGIATRQRHGAPPRARGARSSQPKFARTRTVLAGRRRPRRRGRGDDDAAAATVRGILRQSSWRPRRREPATPPRTFRGAARGVGARARATARRRATHPRPCRGCAPYRTSRPRGGGGRGGRSFTSSPRASSSHTAHGHSTHRRPRAAHRHRHWCVRRTSDVGSYPPRPPFAPIAIVISFAALARSSSPSPASSRATRTHTWGTARPTSTTLVHRSGGSLTPRRSPRVRGR